MRIWLKRTEIIERTFPFSLSHITGRFDDLVLIIDDQSDRRATYGYFNHRWQEKTMWLEEKKISKVFWLLVLFTRFSLCSTLVVSFMMNWGKISEESRERLPIGSARLVRLVPRCIMLETYNMNRMPVVTTSCLVLLTSLMKMSFLYSLSLRNVFTSTIYFNRLLRIEGWMQSEHSFLFEQKNWSIQVVVLPLRNEVKVDEKIYRKFFINE